jgi:hypothetical protein
LSKATADLPEGVDKIPVGYFKLGKDDSNIRIDKLSCPQEAFCKLNKIYL